MRFRIIALAMLAVLLAVSPALAAKPVIRADRTYLDVNSGLYILKGNVFVQVGSRVITASQARVSVASLEVWGSGGVTVTQDDMNFTGDSVYVFGSQNRATIEGGVRFTRTGLAITADRVDYNWKQKLATFSGNVQVIQDQNSWQTESAQYHVRTNTFIR